MKYEYFNKLGGTEFRTKSQINGYIQIANFLLMNNEKGTTPIDLDKKFKEYVKKEQIYSYENDNKINKRIDMVLKLFKQLKIVFKESKKSKVYRIDINKLNEFINNPKKIMFLEMYNNLCFFKDSINFLIKRKKLNSFIFASAIQIYDENIDEFEHVYNELENNYKEVVKKLVFDQYKRNDFTDLTGNDFLDKYKKKPSNKKKNNQKLILQTFEMKKDNKQFNDIFINNIKDIPLFEMMVKLNENGFYKNRTTREKAIRNKNKILKDYLNTIEYNEFFIDANIAKIYSNIGKDYNDLIMRWFADFNLLDKNDITNENLEIVKTNEGNVINIKEIEKWINDYPYSLENVKNKLKNIQMLNFDFKFNDENIKDIPNSTIAEYFVNLYFALSSNIKPNDFKNMSRTIMAEGTLFPLIHAPGAGPDMFLLENENKKLKIIETTIHKTVKEIKNNEVFNVIDHVNLEKIKYINNETKSNIIETEILLITPLKTQRDLNDVGRILKLNYENEDNCGQIRKSLVTNFENIIS